MWMCYDNVLMSDSLAYTDNLEDVLSYTNHLLSSLAFDRSHTAVYKSYYDSDLAAQLEEESEKLYAASDVCAAYLEMTTKCKERQQKQQQQSSEEIEEEKRRISECYNKLCKIGVEEHLDRLRHYALKVLSLLLTKTFDGRCKSKCSSKCGKSDDSDV